MTLQSNVALALLSLMLLVVPVRAGDEDAGSHMDKPHKTILLGAERIAPADVTISKDDSLEFQNLSLHPIQVEFTEPADQTDKIRCELINPKLGKPGKAPWALFAWNDGKRLVAIVPPGRFASVCSLAPGNYAFVTKRVSRDVRGDVGKSGTKGTIAVQ